MHTPLPYESIASLALTRLSLPTSLSDSTICSGAYLTLVAWMSSWVFILCISFLLRAGHCLGVDFPSFNSAYAPFSSFVRGLADALTTPLHCSCYDIIHPYLFCCYFWACGLKHLPCHFLILFFLLVFTAQHSCWASPFNTSGFLNPFHLLGLFGLFHSLGILGPFHSFLPLSFSWAFAKSFELPWPNYHILCLWVYLPANQSHLPIPFFRLLWPLFAFFLFLMILMSLLLHSFGLSQPVCFLWAHLLFCGLMDQYSYHSGPMIFTLLLSFSTFFI